MRRIDDAEAGQHRYAGEHRRNLRRRQSAERKLHVGAAHIFAGDAAGDGEGGTHQQTHAGAEHAHLDRIAHEKQAADGERDAADPHRPARSDRFLEIPGARWFCGVGDGLGRRHVLGRDIERRRLRLSF
jgi:hypothetical protein